MADCTFYKTHDSQPIRKLSSINTQEDIEFVVQDGARLIVSLYVDSGSVSLRLFNGYSADIPYEEILDSNLLDSPNALGVGHHTFVVTDYHKLFKLSIIPSGAASCALGLAVHDNGFERIHLLDENGVAYSQNNPMPTSLEESEGEEVHDYNESAINVVATGSDSHVYTVPAGKRFQFEELMCSCSGRAKFVVEVGTVGSLIRKGVVFLNASKRSYPWRLKRPIVLNAGQIVKITRINNDSLPLSLYTTIIGGLKI